MLGPNDLPRAITGDRCAVIEQPPKERTEGGLHLPDNAKERYYSGKLIDAGLQARDKLYDAGYDIGDDVEFGRYAGLREVWDRIIEWGTATPETPDDEYDWHYDAARCISGVRKAYTCSKTGAVRVLDSVIVVNADDLLSTIQLAARLRAGKATIKRGVTSEGKTMHYIERSE